MYHQGVTAELDDGWSWPSGAGGAQHGSGSPLITAAESVTKKADSYLQRQSVYRGRDGSFEEGGSAPPNQQRPLVGVVSLFPLMGS